MTMLIAATPNGGLSGWMVARELASFLARLLGAATRAHAPISRPISPIRFTSRG